jgi:hypothetical protein
LVVAGLFAGLPLLLGLLSGLSPLPPPPNNALCPLCKTAFHCPDLDRNLTFDQKIAIERRCPMCGHYESLAVFEASLSILGRRTPNPNP